MATTTNGPALTKQATTENYDVGVVNANSDLIADLLSHKGTDILSASTITIPAVGSAFDVTSTNSISGATSTKNYAGRVVLLHFDGALTLTHGANWHLPHNAGNITTEANDRALVQSEGSDAWRIFDYQRATGAPLSLANDSVTPAKLGAGLIVQTTLTTSTTKVTATNQDTETHVFEGAITPVKSGNTIYVVATLNGINPGGTGRAHTLLRWQDNVSGGVTGTQIGGTQLVSGSGLNQGTVIIASFVATSVNPHYVKVTFAKRDSSTTWEVIDQGADDRSSVLLMEKES